MTHGWKSGELDMGLAGDERSSGACKTVMASQLAIDEFQYSLFQATFSTCGECFMQAEKEDQNFY